MDKCRAVMTEWQLVFRHINEEKKEEDRKQRGRRTGDRVADELPREFQADIMQEKIHRQACLLNGAQACLQQEDWDGAFARTSQVLAEDPKCVKALYRRGVANARSGNKGAAK